LIDGVIQYKSRRMADYRSCHSINRVTFIAYIVNPKKINKLNLSEKEFAIIEKRYPKYFETPDISFS
jgi:hypothetical protein